MFYKEYCVCIMTKMNETTLYTDVTNNLKRRVYEHKNDVAKGFTSKYKLHKLVYYEMINEINAAILHEKQIKSGARQKKID